MDQNSTITASRKPKRKPRVNKNVQSVLFNKEYYNLTMARKALKKMGFEDKKVDKEKNYYRFRQLSPKMFTHYITKQIKPGVLLVIGYRSSLSNRQKSLRFSGGELDLFDLGLLALPFLL